MFYIDRVIHRNVKKRKNPTSNDLRICSCSINMRMLSFKLLSSIIVVNIVFGHGM